MLIPRVGQEEHVVRTAAAATESFPGIVVAAAAKNLPTSIVRITRTVLLRMSLSPMLTLVRICSATLWDGAEVLCVGWIQLKRKFCEDPAVRCTVFFSGERGTCRLLWVLIFVALPSTNPTSANDE